MTVHEGLTITNIDQMVDLLRTGFVFRDCEFDHADLADLDAEERTVALVSLADDSRLARDERRAGVVVRSLPCPLLIVTGTADAQWPRSSYDGLWLAADYMEAEGASHWGLVLNRRVLATLVPRVAAWIEKATSD